MQEYHIHTRFITIEALIVSSKMIIYHIRRFVWREQNKNIEDHLTMCVSYFCSNDDDDDECFSTDIVFLSIIIIIIINIHKNDDDISYYYKKKEKIGICEI